MEELERGETVAEFMGRGELTYACSQEETIPAPPIDDQKYSIHIGEGICGYQLQIGCQTGYFEDTNKVFKVVDYYLKNKVECIKAYQQNKTKELLTKILS